MISGGMIKQAVDSLNDMMKELGREINADEIADIVSQHAIATALSAAAAGVVPGTGGAIALGIATASTVTMYGRLANAIGVRLKNGLIRAVASAIVADLAAYVAAVLATMAVVSFIPGIGNIGSAAVIGMSNYAFVYLAGLIFIKLVVALGVKRMETMSEEEIKAAAKNIQKNMDMKAAIREAMKSYKGAKKKTTGK